MSIIVNTGYAKKNDNVIQEASAAAYIADPCTLVMSKTVDKPGEFYFSGDTIVFTITISLPANAAAQFNDITFRDQVPPEVQLPAAAPFGVTTTKGTLQPVAGNLVIITNIDLAPGQTCTITITGTII